MKLMRMSYFLITILFLFSAAIQANEEKLYDLGISFGTAAGSREGVVFPLGLSAGRRFSRFRLGADLTFIRNTLPALSYDQPSEQHALDFMTGGNFSYYTSNTGDGFHFGLISGVYSMKGYDNKRYQYFYIGPKIGYDYSLTERLLLGTDVSTIRVSYGDFPYWISSGDLSLKYRF